MAILLKSQTNIAGISVDDIAYVLGQYADDADIYSKFKQQSLDTIFLCLEHFKSMSGFSVNYDKTSIYRICALEKSDATLISQRAVSWTNEPINVLGVTICYEESENVSLNYQPAIDKAETILCKWGKRKNSLHGKVAIVNSLITSLFVYKMLVLPGMSEIMYKPLQQRIVNFL